MAVTAIIEAWEMGPLYSHLELPVREGSGQTKGAWAPSVVHDQKVRWRAIWACRPRAVRDKRTVGGPIIPLMALVGVARMAGKGSDRPRLNDSTDCI